MWISQNLQIAPNNKERKDYLYTPENYFLYEYHTNWKKFYAIVDKTKHSIAQVINWSWKVVNWFEAGSIRARRHSKNKQKHFIPHIWLWREDVRKKIHDIVTQHKKESKHQSQKKEILNSHISDWIYCYTNAQWEKFEVWILSWVIMNITAPENVTLTWGQKAAITRCVKSYIPWERESRLQPIQEEQIGFWNIINTATETIDEEKIQSIFLDLIQTDITDREKLYIAWKLYGEYKKQCSFSDDEQELLLRQNQSWLIFIDILKNLKEIYSEQPELYQVHESRINFMKEHIWNMYQKKD